MTGAVGGQHAARPATDRTVDPVARTPAGPDVGCSLDTEGDPVRRIRRPATAALAAGVLLLAACGDDTGSSDPIALEDGGDTADPDAGTSPNGEAGGADGIEPAPDQPELASPLGEVVDASVAEPGTWQVGDAGTVTFSVVEGRLSLDEVAPADGWQVTEQEADGDEIEVDLERDGERYEFQVELEDDGSVLEVRIEHDLDTSEAGTFELGDAGSVTVAIDGDRLLLEDLTVADGWQVVTDSRDDDEIEIDLERGDQRWDLEIELDDGRLEVERDHRVRSSS